MWNREGFCFCKGLSVREGRVYMWENGTDISKVMMVMGVRRNRSRGTVTVERADGVFKK